MEGCEVCADGESDGLSREIAAAFKFLEPPEEHPTEFGNDGIPVQSPRFQLSSYVKEEVDPEDEPKLLDPNHPLLDKFQKALKEHLDRQITHLNEEIFELETGAKKTNDARENLGVEAYKIQQTACKQEKEIETCIEELQVISASRKQLEIELEECELFQKDEQQRLFETEMKEMELRREMNTMDLMMYQMTEWTKDMESGLMVNQRVSEKTRKDKIKFADEKRQLDMIIYRLMTEVWRLEAELETMEMQLRVKEKDRERLAEAVAKSNTDIEALESEQRCLLHSWHSVIVVIGSRDKHYAALSQDKKALEEKLCTTIQEIVLAKKFCKAEMVKNERLAMFKTRVMMDIKACEVQLHQETHKKDQLEKQMHETSIIIERIDKDTERLYAENCHKERELNVLEKEYNQMLREKLDLEQEIVEMLQDKQTNDKATVYLRKMVAQVKEKNMEMTISLASTENQNAKVLDLSESQKSKNVELGKKVFDAQSENQAVESQIDYFQDEIDKCNNNIKKRQRDMDVLNKRIETIQSRSAGNQLSPQELKIMSLEKGITETCENNKTLQKFWLRDQGHVCQLSEQRQEQIKEGTILRKQTMILEQRNLKINDELESHFKTESIMNRSISNLFNKLSALNEQLYKKKGSQGIMQEDNNLQQVDYIGKLKDGELEALKVQGELEELEEEKLRLADELIEKNREALCWEKKLKMALETKDNMSKEKGGELGNMKSEIHRMKVRYDQLRKVQDKLIHDLDHCVSRRDAIITGAEAREKRSPEGNSHTRVHFLRKLDDMKNKLRQSEHEKETVLEKLEAAKQDEIKINQELENANAQVENLKQERLQLHKEIERVKTDKQLNLEVLVFKQMKLRTYSELVRGHRPSLLYRTESIMMAEYERQKEINHKLLTVVESLICSFPEKFFPLNRISNTLKLPSLFI